MVRIIIDGDVKDLGIDSDADGVPDVLQPQGDSPISDIIQPTELKDAFNEMNKDEIEGDARMSSIDTRAILHPIEVGNILALDALVSLNTLPKGLLNFTRSKKRLSISQLGKGREQMVDVAVGNREHKENAGGGFGKLLGMGKGNDKK